MSYKLPDAKLTGQKGPSILENEELQVKKNKNRVLIDKQFIHEEKGKVSCMFNILVQALAVNKEFSRVMMKRNRNLYGIPQMGEMLGMVIQSLIMSIMEIAKVIDNLLLHRIVKFQFHKVLFATRIFKQQWIRKLKIKTIKKKQGLKNMKSLQDNQIPKRTKSTLPWLNLRKGL